LDEIIVEDLKNDPESADLYLESAIEEYNENFNKEALLSSLRHLVEAEGVSKIARETGLTRDTFYKSLSPKGNPRLDTLMAIMKALKYKLSLRAEKMS
jgi:probable addiction module antidote protein